LRPNDTSVQDWLSSPGWCCTPVAGRLAPGATPASAQAELAVLRDQFQKENHVVGRSPRILVTATSWLDTPPKKGQIVVAVVLLFLAVTLVLLLECANVGNATLITTNS
jgi:hypothetical protein